MDVPRFDLILSEESNVPLHETAERLARALAAVEADVEIVTGQVARAGRTPLVIDPHVAFAGYPDDQLDAALRGAVCVLTPSPNDPVFLDAVACARASGAVLHVSEYGLRGLAEHLVEAGRLPLGHDPALDRWGGEERPRDVRVAFYGTRTRRRETLLAACAQLVWPHECEWHMLEPPLDRDATRRGYLAAEERADLLARTDVLLCLRSGEDPSLSWLRLADGLTNGALLLCERSVGTAPLRPGHELLMTSPDSLPVMLERVLADDALRERVRRTGYDAARSTLSQRATGTALLNAALRAESAAGRRALVRAARPPAERPAPPAGDDGRAAFARRLARETSRRRQLEAELADARGRAVERIDTPAWAGATPRVTVLLTLFGYGDVVERALDSLVASEGPVLEIVIVDDASQDDGRAVVAGWLERNPQVPARLLALPANVGVAGARNLGAAEARGEALFVMDADNTVYPNGLARLLAALDAAPAAGYAHGIIERRSPDGPVALMSHLEADGARLYRSNDIDAMALVRRSTFDAVGGFHDDGLLTLGSQDWDFWLACAERGLDGVLVPQPVATYHEGHASMTGTHEAVRDALHAEIRARHASLAPAEPAPPGEPAIAGSDLEEPPPATLRQRARRRPRRRRLASRSGRAWRSSAATRSASRWPALRSAPSSIARALADEFECVIAAREVDPRARTPCPAIALGEDALGELLPGLCGGHPARAADATGTRQCSLGHAARGRPLRPDEPRGARGPRGRRTCRTRSTPARPARARRLLHLRQRAPARLLARHARGAAGASTRAAYAEDPDLRGLIDVVPFGIPREAPGARAPGLRGVVAGIGPDDPLFVWNGGLWDWFDPTAVRARDRPRAARGAVVRACFMGVRRPGETELSRPPRETRGARATRSG